MNLNADGGIEIYVAADKTWMISTGVKMGPFGIMDIIGMQIMYSINKLWGEKAGDKVMLARAELIKKKLYR